MSEGIYGWLSAGWRQFSLAGSDLQTGMDVKTGRSRNKLSGYCCEPLVVLADIVITGWGVGLCGYIAGDEETVKGAGIVVLVTVSVWCVMVVKMFGRKSKVREYAEIKEKDCRTVISAGVSVNGIVTGCGDVEVCGTLTGEIVLAEGDVTVRSGGTVDGRIRAENITVEGRVKGRCEGKSVQITESGSLRGECCVTTLSIAHGGLFSGTSEISLPSSEADVVDVTEDEISADADQ
ncbi:TPA: polymer-forming cytoskeletal protein [Escherichia coli]|nr:polymer-forming cytoskeletal protein [Escherichia coli]